MTLTAPDTPSQDALHDRIYSVKAPRNGSVHFAKRTSSSLSRSSGEVAMLRLLSSPNFVDPRNRTAFPSIILWDDRIILTPIYHPGDLVFDSPNSVLDFAKQLIEVRSPEVRLSRCIDGIRELIFSTLIALHI